MNTGVAKKCEKGSLGVYHFGESFVFLCSFPGKLDGFEVRPPVDVLKLITHINEFFC